jgi:hypothetical protein
MNYSVYESWTCFPSFSLLAGPIPERLCVRPVRVGSSRLKALVSLREASPLRMMSRVAAFPFVLSRRRSFPLNFAMSDGRDKHQRKRTTVRLSNTVLWVGLAVYPSVHI